MIRVENLSRNYGSFRAVDSVTFDIARGEIVGLLGHNGAGKTTIMKMLTGYLEPGEGAVYIDGVDIMQNRLVAQEKIGYLPESSPLYPEMNVLQYLEYVADLRAIPPSERAGRIANAVKRTALAEKAYSSITTLSKGYKQRVGVAQAILHQPQILILDEPTNGLDPAQIEEMRSLVKNLAEGATVILSTHILQEVQATCDRVLIMSQGTLARDARLVDLQASTRLLLTVNAEEAALRNALSQMAGVATIQYMGNGGVGKQFAIEVGGDLMESAPALARRVIDSGMELYALAPEQRNLESIFREVNSAERG